MVRKHTEDEKMTIEARALGERIKTSRRRTTMTLGGEVMAGKSMETYGANRIKAGDRLIRERDHLGRPDDAVTVTRVGRKGYTIYYLAGYWRESETPSSLCAQGYRIVERAGERVATFFKRYW